MKSLIDGRFVSARGRTESFGAGYENLHLYSHHWLGKNRRKASFECDSVRCQLRATD